MIRREDFVLRTWGDALRQSRARRRRLVRRAAMIAGLAGLVASSIVAPPLPRLVWNVTASAPTGLYSVTPGTLPAPGDLVIARVPETMRTLAAERHYIPANVPLVKRVTGVPGDTICASGTAIFINDRSVADRLAVDGHGRTMPRWSGCLHLRDGDYFLLMPGTSASFDGRYFGITRRTDIIGRAHLIWATSDGSRHE
ncbi:S26 family signal peptidase [Sphingomonas sp.]|uniref:S26 family signal peptidase n=1 Tax=Sphingomonas sp. TaxID=28214 RepID=UPI000DB3EA1E|nr:S26 family signal peptidase [Sphingomonas sp.]PZU06701.1 MAG: S26 family signal peptidase [Sphingomonas sp.]